MSGYAAFRYWSPLLGCEAVRLSMVDERGGEFYRIIAVDPVASRYREDRDRALDLIEDAIARGMEPGEVREEGDDEDEAA